ncbi:MAG TPA: metalloregulator ArsR/SmtB family transcription factor [Candidatus Krumholzibacteria bacterium]|jgi:predicted ArsR family transcriptional regulator
MTSPTPDSSRQRILHLLKMEGPRTAAQLAQSLGITPMGARQHLAILHEEGLVRSVEQRQSVGRPAHVWSLTGSAHQRFSDSHGELAVSLIESMRETFGEEGLERLLEQRLDEQRAQYRVRMSKAESAGERVHALCEIRNEEGYMAEWWQEGPNFYLAENHCPICEAARSCPGLCRNELTLFQESLGQGFEVERSEHLLEGTRRCVYVIRAA